jgi:hypothetical protein
MAMQIAAASWIIDAPPAQAPRRVAPAAKSGEQRRPPRQERAALLGPQRGRLIDLLV